MRLNWLPWRWLLRIAARRYRFLDPVTVLAQLQNFAQPAEVAAPTELLRAGIIMHARGLINSLAIQHNLDWIWPYWVECQYDPRNKAFIPRSFLLTQLNLTHRNWTALGVLDGDEFSLVDPRGLVTPFFDSWSLDVWMLPEEGTPLIPSRCATAAQRFSWDDALCVVTESTEEKKVLFLRASVSGDAQVPVCQIKINGIGGEKTRLVVSLRPYNPEGVSFIHHIELLNDGRGWKVNGKQVVLFDSPPRQWVFSDYRRGDVYSRLSAPEGEREVFCKVGMASAAAVYELNAGQAEEIIVSVPLAQPSSEKERSVARRNTARQSWREILSSACLLQIPDEQFQFLYDAAIRVMVLHSPREVYPGPYSYRRFWFRDAAFILNSLLCVGLKQRVRRAVDCFRLRQTPQGYFLSQEGEWDANGEALWIMRQYCELTDSPPPAEWKESIRKAGMWICKKRVPLDKNVEHAGLMPAGFSAEHFGPNDFYYWDDFWAVAGLDAAANLCDAYQERKRAVYFGAQARSLRQCIDRSLQHVAERLRRPAIPASAWRRLDSGAIGALVASYPLRIFAPRDVRIVDTVDFLMATCMVHGGFFHDLTHSGINPYLTLQLAQVLLRAGDSRYFEVMSAVARLATSTGQWPESVHPGTGGGCMGDGQHVWAAAEWVLMMRNCFVREEQPGLILCSGIPRDWLASPRAVMFGPAPTAFGDISLTLTSHGDDVHVEWRGQWFRKEPVMDISLPGATPCRVVPGTNTCVVRYPSAE